MPLLLALALCLPSALAAAPVTAALEATPRRPGEPRRSSSAPAPGPAPALAAEPDSTAALAAALRRGGVAPEALQGAFWQDRPPASPPPAAAAAALAHPLSLPGVLDAHARALAAEARALAPSWSAAFALAAAGDPPVAGASSPCTAPPAVGLVALASRASPLRPRQRAWLHAQVSPGLDAVAGELVAQALAARCRRDHALAGLTPAEQAAVLAGLEAALGASEGAAADLDPLWARVDREELLAAGRDWSQAVEAAALALAALPAAAWPGGPLVLWTPAGEVWLGSPGADSLEGDPALLLDPGGDDRWSIGAGRALADVYAAPPVRGLVDLGGDDGWGGGAAGPGGAFLGLSAGLDAAGDDTWRTGPLSQGAAWFGVSTWRDLGGDDAWTGDRGVQGFAAYGLAALRDQGGADRYQAQAWAQGAAMAGGVGLLQDGEGDDRYGVGTWGQGAADGGGPGRAGGLGWLQDQAGDDRYQGGAQVQGSGAWQGLGLLWDRRGADGYDADQQAQGWARHLGAGALVDREGDDRYQLAARGQGGAADRAVGWLWEGGGDDRLTAGPQAQASAQGQALAVLVLDGGADLLLRQDPDPGAPDPGAPDPGVAALVDRGGGARLLQAPPGPPLPALPREADRAAVPADEELRQRLLTLRADLPAPEDPSAAAGLRDEGTLTAIDQGRLHASPAVRRAAWGLAAARERSAEEVPGAGLPRVLGATWAEAAHAAVAAGGPEAAAAA
ncbi:hypothetical protein L6R53_06435, partial [Myxococcota bacterium]|nr:hypothetical protein [Myxococcota bacterium]